MPTVYTEFDTTTQGLPVALRNAILASSDWSRLTPSTAIMPTTAAAAAAATTLTVSSTSGSGLVVGSIIAIEDPSSSIREYRAVTALAATTITVAALSYAHASGTNIYWGSEVLKATTTRGAPMVIDLVDAVPSTFNLNMAMWQNHDGTTGTDRLAKFLYWRPSGGALNHLLHVKVSAGKEHLYIEIEGPRTYETGAVNATGGSQRNYVFMCDLVPYHAGDTTPCVVVGGAGVASAVSSIANKNWQVHQSRNVVNNTSWVPAKMVSLAFPSVSGNETIGVQRSTSLDGNFYLTPYVIVGDDVGFRGRLSSFFYSGMTFSDILEDSGPPVGAETTYSGKKYKLLAVSKSEAATMTWQQFGGASNNAAGTYFKSPVVAVPIP